MIEPRHHFTDDVLRAHAVGSTPEATSLAVACHLAFCDQCRREASLHESFLLAFGSVRSAASPADQAARSRLLAALSPQNAAPPPSPPPRLPNDMPELPAPLLHQLGRLPKVAWRRLIPGIRAIDLGLPGVWRARLVAFHPGIPIPRHDHGGAEHTVVFQGGLDDEKVHLGRGDATTMSPGESHRQHAKDGEPCVALVVSEGPPLPRTLLGRVLKRVTDS